MRSFIISLLLLVNTFVFAESSRPEMADTFRDDGKIYVVVSVVILILLGLLTYIVLTDKKVKELEEKLK